MRPFLFSALVALSTQLWAQDPIWSPDVANIVYTHCSSCHHDGAVAPFSLMSYSDVVSNSAQIPNAVQTRHMPPWPADPAYRHFANENVLTQGEIDALVDFVNSGAPFGDPTLEPSAPVFLPSGSTLSSIDMTLAIPPYTLQYNYDEIRWYTFQNTSSTPIYINKMEVVPGLDAFVHHVDIAYDATNQSLSNDQADPQPGFNSSTGWPNYTQYMNAWQPGGDVLDYPSGWGIEIPPGADFVMEVHYGPGGAGQTDSTLINIEFAPAGGLRPIQVGWSLGQSLPTLLDGPFWLPPNQISTFHQAYTLPNDRSYLAVCPHMHWLGKSYKIWAITPSNDSIPIIDIPQWDFHWQRYYYFQQIQVLPAGTTIYSEVSYDNTIQNPHNPNVPPIGVGLGSGTTNDEMILTFFIWADYQPGDEDIIIDNSLIASVHAPDPWKDQWSIAPNPTHSFVQVNWSEAMDVDRIEILDLRGKTVLQESVSRTKASGFNLADMPAGCYFMRLWMPGEHTTRMFVKE